MHHEERGPIILLLASRRRSAVNLGGTWSILIGSSISLLWLPLHSAARTSFATPLLCFTALMPFISPRLCSSAIVLSTSPLLFTTALTVPAPFRYFIPLVAPVPLVTPVQFTTVIAVHD